MTPIPYTDADVAYVMRDFVSLEDLCHKQGAEGAAIDVGGMGLIQTRTTARAQSLAPDVADRASPGRTPALIIAS